MWHSTLHKVWKSPWELGGCWISESPLVTLLWEKKKKNLTFISDFAIWKRILTCLDIIEGFKISV